MSKITGKEGTVRGMKQGNIYIVCNLEIARDDPEWKPNPIELFVLRVVPNRRAGQSANDQNSNIVEQELRTIRLIFELLS